MLFFFSSSNFVIKDLHDSDCSSHRKPYPIEHSPVLYTLLASYLQRTITGDQGSLTSTDGAGGLEKDTVNLVASFETALVVMPEKERLERFQNTPSLICILPSSLKERDIENNTFNSYANK